MNMTKLKMLGGSCVYFLIIAFSASVNAADPYQVNSGVSIEGWSAEGGRDIPVLSFDETQSLEEFSDDIRAEGFMQDKDGSVRYQLSHSGPLSRQVFANVREVEQDNGLTRSVVTNIADGDQMEFLSRTSRETRDGKPGKGGNGNLLTQLAYMEDQNTECPLCIYFGGWIVVGVACAATASLAHYNCRIDCQFKGGIARFDTGACGSVNSECVCWVERKPIAGELIDG